MIIMTNYKIESVAFDFKLSRALPMLLHINFKLDKVFTLLWKCLLWCDMFLFVHWILSDIQPKPNA